MKCCLLLIKVVDIYKWRVITIAVCYSAGKDFAPRKNNNNNEIST